MKRLLPVVAFTLTVMTELYAQTIQQWPEVTKEMKPGSRWWWMGSAVSASDLEWNIREYAKTGIGTLEITPIYGVQDNEANELQYLSSGWMNALKTCQEAGAENGVDIDMNGGTGWPFGGPWVSVSQAAGKLVTKSDTKTADGNTELTFNVSTDSNTPLNKVLAYQQDGDGIADVTSYVEGSTLKWKAPVGQWLLLAVYNGHTMQSVKRAAPGGEGLVLDHYDAEAVKAYLAHFDERFTATGAKWPHTFFNDSYEVYGADWTPKMFEEFEKYRGYKLEEHMDQLLELGNRKDTGNKVLADYRQTLSDMLLNNFTRPWTAWAHSHGVTTRNQGHGSPGNLIDFYAAVDIPEIESFGITNFGIRGLRTDEGFTSTNLSDFATLKYASSAAHVTGKKWTSSETFTWLAEHFRVSLSQMKPDMDLMFVAGVNHIFFHGTTYSPQQAAWPGWKFYASIDMSPTNSIWRDAPAMMQYATRCQSFLQQGQPDNDLLVYAPFVDAMHKNVGANAARLQLFDINTLSQKIPSMVTAVQNIEKAGLDCDFISDQLLMGVTYEDGMLQTAAGTRYKGLVVPVSTNMPDSVKNHLDDLEKAGAKIVYKSDAASITSIGATPEEIRTDLGLRMIRRSHEGNHIYFISNLSVKDVEGMAALAVPFQSVASFDPLTGNIRQAYTENGKVWLSLKSGESIILQTSQTQLSGLEKVMPAIESAAIPVDSKWTLAFTEDTYTDGQLQSSYTLERPTTWEQLDASTATVMGTGIYETTFKLDKAVVDMANAGMLLDLGDVRESACVYINGEVAGMAWSAPFRVNVSGLLKAGENTIRIEVTNLPANRIRQMDISGRKWRIFKDVNILAIVNGKSSQGNVTYNNWDLVPSGLNGMVWLIPLRKQSTELSAQLVAFSLSVDDYYPTYKLSTPTALPVAELSLKTAEGESFDYYTLSEDKQRLTITGMHAGYLVVKAKDTAGNESETYMRAYGAYGVERIVDFTRDEAPACGWQVMGNKMAIKGFEESVDWRRAPNGNSAKEVTLYDGVTAKSERAAYYFYMPNYGMGPTVDATLYMNANVGDLCLLSYLQGSATDSPKYVAADSLVTIFECTDAENGLCVGLSSRNNNVIYRSLQHFRPRIQPSAVVQVTAAKAKVDDCWYTLHGQRVIIPRQRGIYIRNNKKIVIR